MVVCALARLHAALRPGARRRGQNCLYDGVWLRLVWIRSAAGFTPPPGRLVWRSPSSRRRAL